MQQWSASDPTGWWTTNPPNLGQIAYEPLRNVLI